MLALDIIKSNTLTHEQKVTSLAKDAENSLDVLNISQDVEDLIAKGIICTLFEGNAPYRPRYILPDYELFMKKGSEFLDLKPPNDIWEAINNLMILYKHVPSITNMPVFVGRLDRLLEPFIIDYDEAKKAIKLFLINMDRTITDSFCHANIGPEKTKAGTIILELERELQNAVPNLTLLYNPQKTSDDFLCEAVNTALVTAKPSFANDEMFTKDLGEGYAVASCYNGLLIGGGSYTLVRMILSKLAPLAKDENDFVNNILPFAVSAMADLMDERIRFIMEESGFFESNFLAQEELICKEKFTAMFGLVGLAECVNILINNESERFGHSDRADALGVKIIEKMNECLNERNNSYCRCTNGKFLLHAQVGIDSDINTSPGCRIPIGEEPELYKHIEQATLFHKYFPSGIGDIFPFDKTVKRNPESVMDIVKGALAKGMRYFSTYAQDADTIRITGYLVKRSQMEKLDKGESTLHDTVVLGLNSVKNSKVLMRRVRNEFMQ